MSNAKQPVPVDGFVAQRMRALRKERRMSQVQLAAHLGLTFQQVQKYEKAVNRIGAGRLFDVARILGVPIHMMYPESGSELDAAGEPRTKAKQISEFAMSAEGWRLCRAFLSIKNPQTRKRLLALVSELADKEVPSDDAQSDPGPGS